ncbi:hypothetical protein [Bacillus sp. Marseille-Q3570]|uniref:hypothetical protein n=1 Tax=Bacillus sp. Marseille-Q3570 TaxID=2963522 RepID=UPI0021B7A57C|nr:hypothetical protein [Bacillus sp. Marseille-Q3570]
MGLLKNDKKNDCSGCACRVLKKLEPGTLVRVFNGSQDPLDSPDESDALQFLCFDPKTCIVKFRDSENTIYVLCCEQIHAISLVPENNNVNG